MVWCLKTSCACFTATLIDQSVIRTLTHYHLSFTSLSLSPSLASRSLSPTLTAAGNKAVGGVDHAKIAKLDRDVRLSPSSPSSLLTPFPFPH